MPVAQKNHLFLARHQQGAALMLLLLLVGVGALAVLLSGLNRAMPQLERDRVSNEALARAKEALLGRALADENRPGSLPCPDTNHDGVAESACASLPVIGRFPWKTLKTTELRDGSGESLWYELSANFRDLASSEPLNSNTSGTLDTGAIVAKIYSPGAAIGAQDRSLANVDVVSNYLEGLNDSVIKMSDREVFSGVRKRIAGEIGVLLNPPYPVVMPIPAMPLRFNLNQWDAIVSYAKISDTQSNLMFSGCPGLIFSFNWNAVSGRTDTLWTGNC